MNADERHARNAVNKNQCDGSCDVHIGTVKLVTVGEWGYFAYCDVAIEEDKRRGLLVETHPQ